MHKRISPKKSRMLEILMRGRRDYLHIKKESVNCHPLTFDYISNQIIFGMSDMSGIFSRVETQANWTLPVKWNFNG